MHRNPQLFIECFQRGDRRVPPILMKLFYAELLKFSSKITKTDAESEEIIQDAMVVLWEKRNEFSSILSIRKYLFTVVKNRSITAIEKQKRSIKNLTAYGNVSSFLTEIDEDLDDTEINLVYEIKKLPKQPRIALGLLLEGKSVKEVSEIMKLKESTIHSIKHRGIKALRKILISKGLDLRSKPGTKRGRVPLNCPAGGMQRDPGV